jgi:hypothetical protein
MSGPPFTMSKYVNETELLRDKCAWLEGQLAEQKVSLSDTPKLAEATKLTREIHEMLKRGPTTQDHGLIGNLECILDHFSPDIDPMPEAPAKATKKQRIRLIQTAMALAHRLCPNPTVAQVDDCYEALLRVETAAVVPKYEEPICWLRTLNGKPDWSEDCVGDPDTVLNGYEEEDGYGAIPLYGVLSQDSGNGGA